MPNDAQEKARQEALAQRGVSTGDARNQRELRKIAQRESEKRATEAAAQRAMAGRNSQTYQGSSPRSAGCFAAGTPVLVPGGRVGIETVGVGRTVTTIDPKTGLTSARPVMQRQVRAGVRIWEVRIDSQSTPILTTEHHRFQTQGGWVPVRKLTPGDRISGCDGFAAQVISITRTERSETVYNLVTATEHTYLVAGCLVDSLGRGRVLKAMYYRFGHFCQQLGTRVGVVTKTAKAT